MRKDVYNELKKYTREEQCLLNKSELARRFNCDPRTINVVNLRKYIRNNINIDYTLVNKL